MISIVHRRVGGLEGILAARAWSNRVHRRVGGLEDNSRGREHYFAVHRRVGGLEDADDALCLY